MHLNFKWIVFTLTLLGLTSCASLSHETLSTPQQNAPTWENRATTLSQVQNWHLNGLLAIRTPQNAWTGHWQWQQNAKTYTISLYGPLGTNSIQLTGAPHSVLLETSDGKQFSSTSPEELLEKQLGLQLPVSNLYYWVRGLPAPGMSAQKQLDASNRIKTLIQQGWRIQYVNYISVNQLDLPSKIVLNNATLNVKIVINQWQF